MNPPLILLILLPKQYWDMMFHFDVQKYHFYPNTVELSEHTPFYEIIDILRYEGTAEDNLIDFAFNFTIEHTENGSSFERQIVYDMIVSIGKLIYRYLTQYRLYVDGVLPYTYARTDGTFLYLTHHLGGEHHLANLIKPTTHTHA